MCILYNFPMLNGRYENQGHAHHILSISWLLATGCLLWVLWRIWRTDLTTPWARLPWLCFYQTRSAWSRDQGSNRKHSAVHNFAPTVTKFCVMWEGQALPHDTKFSNCRCEIVGRRVIFIWSLIPGSSWSGLIKAEPGHQEIACMGATGFPVSGERFMIFLPIFSLVYD